MKRMRRWISVLLALCMMFMLMPTTVLAADEVASGTCGKNLTWVLDNEGTLTISGTGEMWGCTYDLWYDYREQIQNVIIEDGVTSIGERTFYDCYLNSVTIPESVTSIDSQAFRSCSLKSVTIPESVTAIGGNAFSECSSLTEIKFEGDAPEIANDAFTDVTAKAYTPEGNETWTKEKMQNYDGAIVWNYVPLVLPENAVAGDHLCANLTWVLDNEGTLTISGEGEMTKDLWDAPWGAYRDDIRTVIIEDGVTSIGGSAFDNCKYLENVTIPDSVTTILGHAFSGCKSLTNITIPESVTWIAYYAFKGSALTEVTIPKNVTHIGLAAFSNCVSLKKVILPEGVSGIEEDTFYYCSALTDIIIPEGVRYIGERAFWQCKSLTSVILPESLYEIRDYAFNNCDSLTEITIPIGVNSIGNVAFEGCSSLSEITFNGRVPYSISNNAFKYVRATAYYPANDPSWTEEVRQNYGGTLTWVAYENAVTSGTCGENLTWVLDNEGTLTISGTGEMTSSPWDDYNAQIKIVVVEEGVTSIGSYAFSFCDSLTSVSIPNSVTYISNNAFYNCDSLTSVTIPGGVTSIGNWAFSSCDSLTSVTIPDSVTAIGDYAFNYCRKLKEIIFEGHVPTISSSAFSNVVAVVYTPEGDTTWTEDKFVGYGGTLAWNPSIPENAIAYGACGNGVAWVLDNEGTLTISGTGEMENFSYGSVAPWFDYVNQIQNAVIEEGVTSIGSSAFSSCSSLTSVTISESVTSIGNSAFNYCKSLTSVTIPESVTSIGNSAFSGCTSLTSVTIPEGVTTISDSAFRSCSSLTSVTIPESVTSIGNSAFSFCSSLTSVIIPESVTSIGESAFSGCSSLTSVTIPEGVTTIGNSTFNYCRKLKEIVFEGDSPAIHVSAFTNVTATAYYPANDPSWTEEVRQNYGGTLTWVAYTPEEENTSASGICGENLTWVLENGILTISGEGAMDDFSGDFVAKPGKAIPWSEYLEEIKEVVIEEGVTSIGNDAFRGCTSLIDINIPDSVTSIGDAAFMKCSALISVSIPEDVTSIGTSAFALCTSLTSLTIPEGVASVEGSMFFKCTSLTNVDIPNSVMSIGEAAFQLCSSLTDVTIPEGVTNIGVHAFNGCASLTHVNIPESLTSIGDWTFRDCTSLTNVIIPDSVTSIGFCAFSQCSKLTKIVFEGNAPEFDASAFTNITTTAYYPAGNETWTEEIMANNYGAASITWTPYTSLAGISVLSSDTNVGETVLITVNAAHASDETYAAAELILGYDAELLEFNEEASELNGAVAANEAGVLTIEHYGEKKDLGDIYTLAFDVQAEGETEITLSSAAFIDQEDAVASDLIPALLAPEIVSLKIGGELFEVTFPEEDIKGATQVENGKDYTFSVKEYDRYNYIITATVNGESVTVIDNGDGSYTIENVTGALAISVEKTPRTFDVAFTGTGAADVLDKPANAVYMTDYTFTLPTAMGYVYQITGITIGEKDYTGYSITDNICTIPGKDIIGNIAITVDKTAGDIPVKVEGSGAGMAGEYVPTAVTGQSYTLTIIPEEGYTYTVTATMGGEPVELIVNENSYTIENVTGEIVFTIERTVIMTGITVQEYVALDGVKIWLVLNEIKLTDGKVPAYDGKAMYWSEEYKAYCLPVAAETLSVEEAVAKMDIIPAVAAEVDHRMDVNMTSKLDASDAQMVYNIYNAVYGGITEEATVEKYLRADINGDRKVDVEDAAAIISAIFSGNA